MSLSPRLSLPYLAPAQSQKHVTVNEALRKLDAIVQLSVVSRTVSAQPGAPADGDVYILPSGKTGAAWATMTDLSLAYFVDGAWSQLTSKEGWRAFVQDSNEFIFYDGAAWTGAETPLWGVNTPADAANKLAVKSNAVLFDALDAAEGGTGDAQVKVNKEAAGDNASHLFQTGFSGRAEFGLTGDDDFHLKVSADGAAWTEALVVDKATGGTAIKFPGFWRWYHSTDLIVTGAGVDVVWNTASDNPGGAYNTANGEFTAPATALYMVNVNFNTNGGAAFNLDVRVNAAPVTRIQFFPASFSHLSKTFLVAMSAGDVMDFQVMESSTVRFDGGGLFDNVVVLQMGRL